MSQVLFGSLAAIVGTGALVRGIEYRPGLGAKQAAWMLHCGVFGAVLAPMCMLGGPLLMRAAVYTAGLVGGTCLLLIYDSFLPMSIRFSGCRVGLSAVAVCAPSDKFLTWSAPLSMGLGVVFMSSIGTWFLPPTSALGAGALPHLSHYLSVSTLMPMYKCRCLVDRHLRWSAALLGDASV